MSRYMRQETYLGKEAQEAFKKSTVCIVGMGALGSVAAELLARAGIGSITCIDRDFVELNNLQRQSLYTEADIGRTKAEAAKERLLAINSQIHMDALVRELYSDNIDMLGNPDVLIAATDNMESRFLMNEYARKHDIPMIHGATVAERGTVMTILPEGPCLRCAFKGNNRESCTTSGILNAASHMTGSLMANEALKTLLQKSMPVIIHFNIWKNTWDKIDVKKMDCPVCQGMYSYLDKKPMPVKLCGKGMYQFRGMPLENSMASLEHFGDVKKLGKVVHAGPFSVFADGRVFVRSDSKEDAQQLFKIYLNKAL